MAPSKQPSMQAVRPQQSCPGGQTSQAAAPAAEKVPPRQGAHSPSSVAPELAWKVPAGHSQGAGEAAQPKPFDTLRSGQYVPGGQDAQLLAPAPEVVPGAQGATAPPTHEVPGSQGAHAAAPAGDVVPSSHVVGAILPAAQKVPGGHSVQTESVALLR